MSKRYSGSPSGDIKRKEELHDMTKCCICTEVYTDPRALPCIHTFCMKCIKETGLKTNKRPGDEMPCPICRRLFKIPTEGFPGLPKHFFIEGLIQVSKEYQSNRNVKMNLVCDIHKKKALDVYCTECKVVVCAMCFIEKHRGHTGDHVDQRVNDFRKQIQNKTDLMNKCITQAKNKQSEVLKVKEEMRQMVKALERDVEKRKDKIKQLADKQASLLLQGLGSDRHVRLKNIQVAKDDIDAYLSNLESYNSYCREILAKGSASDICSSLQYLSLRALELQQQCQPITEREIQDFKIRFRLSEQDEHLEEDLNNLFGEIEEEGNLKKRNRSKRDHSAEIDNLRQEKNKLKQELDAEKMTNRSLKDNFDKLKQELLTEKRTSRHSLKDMERGKEPAKTVEPNAETRRKQPETTKSGPRYTSDPVLVFTIKEMKSEQEQKWIRGLTILDKELFVLSGEGLNLNGSSEVKVYDSIKFSLTRRLNLKEMLTNAQSIESCNINKCLYIFDIIFSYKDRLMKVFRVDPNGKLIKDWSIGIDSDTLTITAYGMSVTEQSNVLLTHAGKLSEYSPDGQLKRTIILSSDTRRCIPSHAIKLTNGHYVVSNGDDLHGVCILDVEGQLVTSSSGRVGSSIGQMKFPTYLSVDGKGFVMVVDQGRVLLFDPELNFKREILSKEEHGLGRPQKIFLDESNGRLLVADNESKNHRISVFNLK